MMKTLFRRTRWGATPLVVGLLILAGAAPVHAQDASVTSAKHIQAMTPVAWQNLSIELTLGLDAPEVAIRQQSLQLVTFFATNYHDQIDLQRALPRLLRIYETDAEEGYRIMALTALHAIGDASTMAYLRERVRQETSPRVRLLTLAALADFDRRTL